MGLLQGEHSLDILDIFNTDLIFRDSYVYFLSACLLLSLFPFFVLLVHLLHHMKQCSFIYTFIRSIFHTFILLDLLHTLALVHSFIRSLIHRTITPFIFLSPYLERHEQLMMLGCTRGRHPHHLALPQHRQLDLPIHICNASL